MKKLIISLLLASPLLGKEYYQNRTKNVLEQANEYNCKQYLCGRIKIKEGALSEVREWFAALKLRKEELLEAFTLEGVWLESVFLEHTPEGDYLVYYMRQDDLEKVYENLAKFQLPIRLFHVECWKKHLDECQVLEPLFDLAR